MLSSLKPPKRQHIRCSGSPFLGFGKSELNSTLFSVVVESLLLFTESLSTYLSHSLIPRERLLILLIIDFTILVEGYDEGILVLAHPLLPLFYSLLVSVQLPCELLDPLDLPRQVVLVVVALVAAVRLLTFSFLLYQISILMIRYDVLLLLIDLRKVGLGNLFVLTCGGGDHSLMGAHLRRSLHDDVVSRDLPSRDPRRAVLLGLCSEGALVHEAVTHVIQFETRHLLRTDLGLRDVLGEHVDVESRLLYQRSSLCVPSLFGRLLALDAFLHVLLPGPLF